MAKESFYMCMVTNTMGNGLMIRPMDMGFIRIQMARDMKVIGKMICSMVGVKKNGWMEAVSKVIMMQAENMDRVLICGLMAQNFKVNGLRIKSMVKGVMNG